MGDDRGVSRRRRPPKGYIQHLASGSLRVRVYAGVDVLTGREHYLSEVVPAGSDVVERAKETRKRLVDLVSTNRQPKTNASLSVLLRKHLEFVDLEPRGRHSVECYLKKHIEPKFGRNPIGSLRTYNFEWFYVELRRCRDHCDGQPFVKHRIEGPHKCTVKCRPHTCRPLGAATIRKLHFLLNAAYDNAVVWEWVTENPVTAARKPAPPAPHPDPPQAHEAAMLLNEAWRHGYGAYVWLAMTTGARRGELCCLRWRNLLVRHTTTEEHDCFASDCQWSLEVRKALSYHAGETWEKDTKTHQMRKIALDPESVAVLLTHREQVERDVAALGLTLSEDSVMFAASPDGAQPMKPPSISQRYARWAKRLGIKTSLKALRHYSATELIVGGVDVRTVAGRLGHAGGGTTTLKIYAAWVSEADQRASVKLMTGMPGRPTAPVHPTKDTRGQRSPYLDIAESLARRITDGRLAIGDALPTVKDIADTFQVSIGTAHRAITVLADDGLISASRGVRAVVITTPPSAVDTTAADRHAEQRMDHQDTQRATSSPPDAPAGAPIAGKQWVLADIVHLGVTVRTVRAHVDPADYDALLALLHNSLRRLGVGETAFGEYELMIRSHTDPEPIAIVVAA